MYVQLFVESVTYTYTDCSRSVDLVNVDDAQASAASAVPGLTGEPLGIKSGSLDNSPINGGWNGKTSNKIWDRLTTFEDT